MSATFDEDYPTLYITDDDCTCAECTTADCPNFEELYWGTPRGEKTPTICPICEKPGRYTEDCQGCLVDTGYEYIPDMPFVACTRDEENRCLECGNYCQCVDCPTRDAYEAEIFG